MTQATLVSSLGQRLTHARVQAGLSQAELSRRVGISEAAVSQLESGDSKDIAGKNVFPIADAVNVSARWLLTGENAMAKDGAPKQDFSAEVVDLARHLATVETNRVHAALVLLGVRR